MSLLGWLFGRRDEGEFGRSGAWPRVRREHLAENPECIACGRKKDLEVHHVQPYHKRPDLELDRSNLVSMCGDPCHFVFGHLMNWKRANPDVREDCRAYRAKIKNFGELPEES